MPKTKISEFSSTPANNTDIDSINIAENCPPSGINDAIRELMAQLKDWQSGTSNDPYVVGSSGSLTLNQGTANGVTYLNGSKVVTSGSALSFDGSNLGLGVTPSAWDSSWKAFQIGTRASFVSAGDSSSIISQNAQFNSGWKYISTAAAGLYVAAFNGQHQWFTAASGTAGNAITFTQAMTLDASSNLMVGTTTAIGKFTVQQSTDSSAGGVAIVSVDGNGAVISRLNDGGLTFRNGGSERARIDSSGNLLVGKTSSSDATTGVRIASNGLIVPARANGEAIASVRLDSDGSVQTFFRGTTGGSLTQVGSISVTTTATAYNTSSDYRLKNTIAPMTGALAKVAQLKPVTYKWNADGSDGQGFIAHELAEVCPDAVTGEKDAIETYTDEDGNEQTRPKYQGIDVSFLVATLTAALQELDAKFEAYKATHP